MSIDPYSKTLVVAEHFDRRFSTDADGLFWPFLNRVIGERGHRAPQADLFNNLIGPLPRRLQEGCSTFDVGLFDPDAETGPDRMQIAQLSRPLHLHVLREHLTGNRSQTDLEFAPSLPGRIALDNNLVVMFPWHCHRF
ncbi:hypothetical protein [Sphingopyxis sp. YF1]|uniref:hypothetical protein n=1 Tax=Sphingopyxis sp. YF1 TaxID=2482763 RepID=UPI001F6115F6|nr:hypothetical protein [Sphingopyxis sp. YF1]